ncbi:MAG: NADH-ubiquinone oxidoreductase chain J, partial [uncultured Nocardioides sp.]
DLLDPGPDHGGRSPRHPVRPQGRARRPAARRGDDQPRGALRRARGAVPVRRADHRLHRRHPHALPLRAHARRGRCVRLRRGDDQGSAHHGHRARPGLRGRPGHRVRPDLARHRGRSRGGQHRRQHRAAREHPVLALRLRLRGHQRAADHRGDGRDGARPPRAPDSQGLPVLARRTADAGLRRAGQAPRSAARPRRLRPSQRRRHPGAAARRHRVGGFGVPGPGSAWRHAVGAHHGRRHRGAAPPGRHRRGEGAGDLRQVRRRRQHRGPPRELPSRRTLGGSVM